MPRLTTRSQRLFTNRPDVDSNRSVRQRATESATSPHNDPTGQPETSALRQRAANAPDRLTVQDVLRLQNKIGNHAVTQLISRKKASSPPRIQRAFEPGRVVSFENMVVLPGHVWIKPGTKAIVTKSPEDGGDMTVQFTVGPHKGTTARIGARFVVELPDHPLTELIKLVDEERLSGWNDDFLLDILRGPFASNWFNLRNSLTLDLWPSEIPKAGYPKRPASLLLMNKMVEMRDKKWKAFKEGVLPKVKEEVKRLSGAQKLESVGKRLGHHQDSPDQAKTFDPVGSQAVTSDIDLSMGGKNTEIAVGFMNREFRKEFKVPYDPGTMFDINLYASDWIHGDTLSSKETDTNRVLTPKPESKVGGTGMLAPDRRTDQLEIWSLVKMRRNMTLPEWEAYKMGALTGLDDDHQVYRMRGKFERAESEYAIFQGKIRIRMKEIAAADKLLKKTGEGSIFGTKASSEGLETRASNDIYAEILLRVKDLRVQIELKNAALAVTPADESLKKEINRLGIALGYAIAEALTYANEVYASEGAVQHTVLAQGAPGKLDKLKTQKGSEHLRSLSYNLTKEAYMQAVNENIGDSLHSLHAYEKVPGYAVYRSGKYLARLIDSATKLLGNGDSTKGAKIASQSLIYFTELKEIGDESVTAKSVKTPTGKSRQLLEGVPDTVLTNPFFAKQTEHTIEELRKHISIFSAAVTVLSQNAPQPDEAPQDAPPDVGEQVPVSARIDELPPEMQGLLKAFNETFTEETAKEEGAKGSSH